MIGFGFLETIISLGISLKNLVLISCFCPSNNVENQSTAMQQDFCNSF